MPTPQQIQDIADAAVAFGIAKKAFVDVQAAVGRCDAILNASQDLINAMAADGASADQWTAVYLGRLETQTVRAGRVETYSAANDALTTAQTELDAALAAAST